jgi:hypothetical protein
MQYASPIMNTTIDARSPIDFATKASHTLYGSLGCKFVLQQGSIVLDDITLPNKRTVLFAVDVRVTLINHPHLLKSSDTAKLTGLEMLDIEKKILDKWDFYWKQAMTCKETNLNPIQQTQ